jgi:hypothetical protein
MIKTNSLLLENSIQEQVHRFRRQQLPIHRWWNRIELMHVISPGEFNLESSKPPIVTKAADLKISNRLTLDVQGFYAVDTIAHPLPAARAPMKVGIEVARHQAGSTSVFSRISRRQFGHFAGDSRM